MAKDESRRRYKKRYYRNHKAEIIAKVKAAQRRNVETLRRLVRERKSRPCLDCGISYPYYVMDLDHRDGTVKVESVGNMVGKGRVKQFLVEIEKCDPVCANCHRERTYRRSTSNGPEKTT